MNNSNHNPNEVLGVITARGGSKTIAKKSIAPCAGNPLMFYTIEAAKYSKLLSRIIITTDDEEIAEFAKSNGIEVPFIRPEDLARDSTPDLPVFAHVLSELNIRELYTPNVVVHLRPTTPLKKASDIDTAVKLLLDNPEAQSVRSVCEPLHTPFKMYSCDKESGFLKPLLTKEFPDVFDKYPEAYNMPRQLLPKIWRHSGYVDVVRSEVITKLNSMSGSRVLPLYFEKWRDIDIDSLYELKFAEKTIEDLKKRGTNPWE